VKARYKRVIAPTSYLWPDTEERPASCRKTEISLIKLAQVTFARLDTIGPWSHDPVGSGRIRNGQAILQDQANVRGSGRFWFSDTWKDRVNFQQMLVSRGRAEKCARDHPLCCCIFAITRTLLQRVYENQEVGFREEVEYA
jgi:hypothetical protein